MEKFSKSATRRDQLIVNDKTLASQIRAPENFYRWEQNIESGNTAFDEYDFMLAETLYKSAIQIAISVFTEQAINKQTISMLLVSFHNIADLYTCTNCHVEAEQVLGTVLAYIQKKLKKVPANSQEAVDLTWGLMKAKRQLVTFTKQQAQITHETTREQNTAREGKTTSKAIAHFGSTNVH